MAVLLALVSALAYGVSDFVGGIIARRAPAWQVAVVGQSSSAVCAALLGLVLVGTPATADWVWGALAGLGGGVGAAFLYRGLAGGRMSVVAPVSAVGAALVPVGVGLLTGDRPPALAWIGIVLAFPAIVLVSRTAPDVALPEHGPGGVVDGVLAGLGFGLLFVFLDRIGEDAGIMPLAVAQVASVVSVIGSALLLRQTWVPRGRAWTAAAMGPLGATATGAFLYATHAGLLSIVSVISSLYPATTVLLAAVLLREQIHRVQGIGLVLAGLAVSLVALG